KGIGRKLHVRFHSQAYQSRPSWRTRPLACSSGIWTHCYTEWTLRYSALAYWLPRFLRRHVLHFEVEIEDAVAGFARELPADARVLDAGAGEGQYADLFDRQRYVGVDLAVGDPGWDYSGLDATADLTALPFRDGVFDAALHIVTIEHLREPGCALAEIGRTLSPHAPLLVV